MLFRLDWLNEFVNSFSGSLAVQCEMRPILVVFAFPPLKFSDKIPFVAEVCAPIELFRIGLVAALNFAINLRASGWDVAMRNSEVREVPGELRPKRGVIVGLDLLNGEGEVLTHFREEVDGSLGVVVIIDTQNSKSRGFINGCELIEALAGSSHARNEFHVELHGTAWDLKWSIGWLWPRAIFLQRDPANVVAAKDFKDGCWRDISVIVPLKVETGSNRSVASLLPNPENEGNDLRRNAIPDSVGPP